MTRAIGTGLSIALATALALSATPFCASGAFAVDDAAVTDAQAAVASSEAVLDEAQAALDVITAEYDELSAQIRGLQEKIDALASQVLEAQAAMLDGRSALSTTVVNEYRNGMASTMLNVILGSSDWSELVRNVDYVGQIMSYQASEIEQQRELKDEFMAVSKQLTTQKNEQETKLSELTAKREEAMRVVDEASAKVGADNARLAEMRRQADEIIWTSPTPQPVNAPAAADASAAQNSGGGADGAIAEEGAAPVPVPETPPAAVETPTDGWSTGLASAYGGSSDPSTPNPGTTANGSICDDDSMGVAIPISWPNRSSYYGRTIEINYNGMTVYGTINDCGNLQNYGRALDLQPGIFKAFGFSTCQAWGSRTVSYRIL